MFIIYASKLVKTVNAHLPDVYCCADDSHLYHFLKPNSQASQDEAVIAMQHCIEDIRQWMLTDRIKLNDDKSEYLLMGTRQQLSKISAGYLVVRKYQSTESTKKLVHALVTIVELTLEIVYYMACRKQFF